MYTYICIFVTYQTRCSAQLFIQACSVLFKRKENDVIHFFVVVVAVTLFSLFVLVLLFLVFGKPMHICMDISIKVTDDLNVKWANRVFLNIRYRNKYESIQQFENRKKKTKNEPKNNIKKAIEWIILNRLEFSM